MNIVICLPHVSVEKCLLIFVTKLFLFIVGETIHIILMTSICLKQTTIYYPRGILGIETTKIFNFWYWS